MATGAAGILVRTYKAKSQTDAAEAFSRDAASLAEQGYTPISQSWAPGSYGCGAFLVALALCVVLIGILVFIYMLIVKPDGALTVTYQRSASTSSVTAHAPAPPQGTTSTQLKQLERLAELRDRGVLTPEEFESKKQKLLGP